MKRILVIYYSQTGQLAEIVHSVTSPLVFDEQFELTIVEIQPREPFPFPWTGNQFFQAFPESVREIPCELEPLDLDTGKKYDLVILAYQVWYLSPSIPFNAFLQSPQAVKILRGRPVITLIGSRNMWIMAQERVKNKIRELGGILSGNIVLIDRAPNLISVVTIIRWLIRGKREAGGFMGKMFPRAGVSEKDIRDASRFGDVIRTALKSNRIRDLQTMLLEKRAVVIDPVLMSIEKRGYIMFRVWAGWILKKGNYGDPARDRALTWFKYYLFGVIFLVSPIASLVFHIIHTVSRKNALRQIGCYSGTE